MMTTGLEVISKMGFQDDIKAGHYNSLLIRGESGKDTWQEMREEMREQELSAIHQEYRYSTIGNRRARMSMRDADWIPVGGDMQYSSFDLERIQSLLWWLYRNNWLCANVVDNFSYLIWGNGFSVQWGNDGQANRWKEIAQAIDWRMAQRERIQATMCFGEYFTLLLPLGDVESDSPQKIKSDIVGLDPWNVKEIVCDPAQPRIREKYCAGIDTWYRGDDVLHHRVKWMGNYRRGLPICLPVLDPLYWAEKALGNQHWVHHIRCRIPLIWRVTGGSEGVDAEKARVGTTLPKPGTVWFQNQGATAEFPNYNIKSTNTLEVYRGFVLATATGVGLPEFMVGASAEQSAYASLLAQESPTVQKIIDFQGIFRGDFRKIISALTGSDDFQIEVPPVVQRDLKSESEAYAIIFDRGMLSKQTFLGKLGLEWEGEEGEKEKLANEMQAEGAFIPGESEEMVANEYALSALRTDLRARYHKGTLEPLLVEIGKERGPEFVKEMCKWVSGNGNE
jgi:hypothetical protein